jgi:type VI secretion system protein ImpA
MASPAVLDLDSLLAPVSAESPAGANLREDFTPTSIYYELKDARTAARAAERRAQATYDEEDGGEALPDWNPILERVPEVLVGHAKDLELTAWLIEALLRRDGFAGLRDGFRLARGLVENFWDDLFPRPDEDGIITKLAPLTGLNGEGAEGTLIAPISMVEITQGMNYGPFNSWQYDQAQQVRGLDPDALEKRVQEGAITPEIFHVAVGETDIEFFRTLIADLDGCIDEFKQLTAILDELAGADSPPSSAILQSLEAVREKVTFITKDLILEDTPPEVVEAASEGGGRGPSANGGGGGGPLKTREDAFRTLQEVSEYFRRNEPHSPISYLLQQSVRWGRLSLPELVKELIQDSNARDTYFKLTGIPSGSFESESESSSGATPPAQEGRWSSE